MLFYYKEIRWTEEVQSAECRVNEIFLAMLEKYLCDNLIKL